MNERIYFKQESFRVEGNIDAPSKEMLIAFLELIGMTSFSIESEKEKQNRVLNGTKKWTTSRE